MEEPDALPSALARRKPRHARVRFTYPDGKKQILDLRPGTVFWIDGVEHAWELLVGEVNVVAVEVKSAKAAKAAKAK